MMQGTVMKITEHCIVVLCEDGTFRNLPHPPVMPGLGEKISVPVMAAPAHGNRYMRFLKKQWIYAASLILLLGAVFIFNYLQGAKQPVTFVAVDINPGLELVVNKHGRVDQVNLLNEDAMLLLSGKELENEDVYEALQLIFAQAEQQGYLDPESGKKWIWLSIVGVGEAAYAIDPHKITVQDKSYYVEVFALNEQQREKAQQEQLSLNKYIVKERAAEKGIPLSAEQLRSQSILSSLQEAGVDPLDLFDEGPKTEHIAALDQQVKDSNEDSKAVAEPPARQTSVQQEPILEEDSSANRVQSEAAGNGEIPEDSRRAQGADERNSVASVQQQPGTSAVQAQEEPAAEKTGKSPQAGSQDIVQKLNLEIKLAVDGKVKLDYKIKDGKPEAKLERKVKQNQEKQQGQQAVSFAENLLKQLDLNEQSDRKAVQSLLLSALKIEEDGWLELQFEAEYSNGGKLKFQLENPLKAQIKAEEKKQEQERKEQEKANKKAEAQDKKKDKDNDNNNDKNNGNAKGQGEKPQQANMPAQSGKKNHKNNDDND